MVIFTFRSMSKRLQKILLFFLLAGIVPSQVLAQFYQGSQNEFGKNRVQYREFLWQQYRFEEYDTYFYEGGQQLATFVSKIARQSIFEIEETFDYSMSDKIQFIVYNTHSDFKQSNVGITGDDQFNIGGVTRIVGSKVFVYFNGDYIEFAQQVKDGLARVLVNQMLYGGNWRQVIKNSTLLNLPEWYIEGLIIYSSGNYPRNIDSRIRHGIMSGSYDNFNRLEGQDAHIAGYALWNYVAETYGENVLPNILYMSKVSRNVESGFLFVLGKSLETITKEFVAYYRGEFAVRDVQKAPIELVELPIKTKKKRIYTQFEISPDGMSAAYVSNVMGQYRIYIYDIASGKRKKILKAEHRLERIVDYSFPIIKWHPSGQALSYIQEWRGKLMLCSYNLEDKKTTKRELFQLDKILSMEYSPNGQQIILSGVDNGQTDLYLYYNIGNRQERLTNDYYGDFDPTFTKDGKKVIFTSTRPDDTLRVSPELKVFRENRDVYAFNLESRSPYLERITDTPNIIEYEPFQYDSIRYSFRGMYDGTYNRYVATYDSVISRIDTTIHYRYFTTASPLTNYNVDILNYSSQPNERQYGFMTYTEDGYHFYVGDMDDDVIIQDGKGISKISRDDEETKVDDGIETLETIRLDDPKPNPEQGEVVISDYQFEGEKDFEYQKETITIAETESPESAYSMLQSDGTILMDTIPLPGARNYNTNFTTDKVLAQLDNSFMTEFYQPISGLDNLNPGLSGLIQYAASDLLEDYKVVGGFRLAGNLDNNTVMLQGQDLSKRLDKRLQLFRLQQRGSQGFNSVFETVTYSGALRYSWPFNEVLSVRGSFIYRTDERITLATDRLPAETPSTRDHYVGLKGEFVFDNTLHLGLNLRRGMRWKVWGEYYKDPTNFSTDFIVFGMDFRHYTKIHRNLVWANRVAGSSSIGKERLVHYLGGVDDWLSPREDNSLPLDPDQNYKFQTRGSPMRGFYANSRNGNSFAVINTEIRWPIFSYLYNKPIKSDLIENFQIIAFGDMGSAWTGPHPYSDENEFNRQTINTGNLEILVKNNKDPVVYGYGFGIRSRFLGYFVRLDWAWGVDDGVVLDRVFYLSLAMDF